MTERVPLAPPRRAPSFLEKFHRTIVNMVVSAACIFWITVAINCYLTPSPSTSFSITTGGKIFTNDKALASGKDCFCSGEFYLCNATETELSSIKNQSSDPVDFPQGSKRFWEVAGKGEQAGDICKNVGDEETEQEIEKLGDLLLKFGEQMRETFV